jgi:hypothetical protein
MADKKLAKEVLDQFMVLFAGMAAFYQPRPASSMQQNPNANESKFDKYAKLAVECAKDLAPYQSPTFRSVIRPLEQVVFARAQAKSFGIHFEGALFRMALFCSCAHDQSFL